tara:strand:- start:1110 stop:1949 length:840 start_codon:yes stop_codon:yes gene_type:complete
MVLIFTSLVFLNSNAGEFTHSLRFGAGMDIGDYSTQNENNNSIYSGFLGAKSAYEKNRWEYSLSLDLVRYNIENNLINQSYSKAKHTNDNILISISPKYKFKQFKIGPYLGTHLDENIILIDERSKNIAGLGLDYDLNKKLGLSFGLEQNIDTTTKYKLAKIALEWKFRDKKDSKTYTCEESFEIVYFSFGSSELSKEEQLKVRNFVKKAKGRIRLSGHTDKIGENGFNDKLSIKRVNSVKKIVDKLDHPIEERLHFGERKPRSQERKENRRVEMSDCK